MFDTSSFIVVGHYYPGRFPSFWTNLNRLVEAGCLTSVSEVRKELDNNNTQAHLATWVKSQPRLFTTPTSEEMAVVARIFGVPAFQALVKEKDRLKGSAVADPFVVARASVIGGCVVTEERVKPNAIRIPTVCSHFSIECTDIEGLMAAEGWRY